MNAELLENAVTLLDNIVKSVDESPDKMSQRQLALVSSLITSRVLLELEIFTELEKMKSMIERANKNKRRRERVRL